MSSSPDVKKLDWSKSKDGEQLFEKLMFLYKPAAYASLGLGTLDVLLYSKPKGYMDTIIRYGRQTWPLFVGATAFVCVIDIAARFRKKNDEVNWLLGGATLGPVWGLWAKTGMGAITVTVAAGITAMGWKHCYVKGWNPFPTETKPIRGASRAVNQDWTLMKHRPGNYTTGTGGA